MRAFCLSALVSFAAVMAAPGIVYDQRQTGTGPNGVNVHVQLEDLLLLWLPGKGGDPLSMLPIFKTSPMLKSTSGTFAPDTGYLGPAHHLDVTVPPEFQAPQGSTSNSSAVQEALAASQPEIPEPETSKPDTSPQSTEATSANSPITQQPIRKIPQKIVQAESEKVTASHKITQAVIDSVTNPSDKVTEKLSSDKESHTAENPSNVEGLALSIPEMRYLNPSSQAIALFKIKQDSQNL